MDRCKNFFALGMCYWLYNRTMDATYRWLDDKFKGKPVLAEANKLAMRAGYAYCDATEAFQVELRDPARQARAGTVPQHQRQHGAGARLRRRVAAERAAAVPGQLPDHARVRHPARAVDVQGLRRDDVPGRGRDRGRDVGHRRGLRRGAGRSPPRPGPGMALKIEAIGLAIAVELPLVICDIQRGGPSTGLPTKTEQADLLQAMFGRNSEAPVPVLARVHARRLLLGRAGGEPHRAQVHGAGDRAVATATSPTAPSRGGCPTWTTCRSSRSTFRTDPEGFHALRARSADALAALGRARARPGLEHRIGGLEKQDVTGNVNYEPLNHEKMVQLRAAKVAAIVQDVPDVVPAGDPDGDLLLVGWGSTYGAITAALRAQRAKGRAHRPRAPAPPESASREPGRRHEALQEGAGAGDEPGPAAVDAARQVPGGREG